MFNVWAIWFGAWLLAGAWLGLSVLQRRRGREVASRKQLVGSILLWSLFSAVAAEVTRQALIVYRPSLLLCAAVIFALMLVGAVAGWLSAWFAGSVSPADIVAGIIGAWLVGWMEIVLSYNPRSYVLPVSALGAVFATFAARIAANENGLTSISDSEQV